MAVIDDGKAQKVFAALDEVREFLPLVEALSALVPGFGFELVEAEKVLGKVFEAASLLRSHDAVADASAELRRKTELEWQDALRR